MPDDKPPLLKAPETEAAKHLEDLFGIHTDLAMVANWCRQAMWYRVRALNEPGAPPLLIDSDGIDGGMVQRLGLQAAILITYRRCFVDGKRCKYPEPLREEALSIVPGGAEWHDWLWDNSNKYTAHSVNYAEQTRVGIFFDAETLEPSRPAQMQLRQVMTDQEIENTGIVTQALIVHLEDAIEEQTSKVMAEARELTPDQVRDLKDHKITAPDRTKPHVKRKT